MYVGKVSRVGEDKLAGRADMWSYLCVGKSRRECRMCEGI
jgi:hypothetical protein